MFVPASAVTRRMSVGGRRRALQAAFQLQLAHRGPSEAQIFPRLRLVGQVAQQIGRMIGYHQRHVADNGERDCEDSRSDASTFINDVAALLPRATMSYGRIDHGDLAIEIRTARRHLGL